MHVADVVETLTRDEFVKEQTNDQTLEGCRNKIGLGWSKTRGGQGKVSFEKRRELLYRVYVNAKVKSLGKFGSEKI